MLKKQIALFIFFVGIMAGAGDAAGAEKYNTSLQPLPALEEIKPVPEIGEIAPLPEIKETAPPSKIEGNETDAKSDDGNLNQTAKKKFAGMIGIIDRMGEKNIVLDDNLCNISPNMKYYTKNGKEISKSSFREGERVGFVLNPADYYEVISIWKIK